MNQINFLGKPSFPLSSNALDFMQGMIRMIALLAGLGGKNYILSGCEVTGTSVADGYVVINGELLPFKGGTLAADVVIVENTRDVTALGETYPQIYVERYVRFGSGSPQYKWDDIARLDTSLVQLGAALAAHTGDNQNPHAVTATQVGLDKVDNTSDADKPISEATKTALDNKIDKNAYPQVIYMGSAYIGDMGHPSRPKGSNVTVLSYVSNGAGGDDALLRIAFDKSVGRTDYLVFGSLRHNTGDWNSNNDMIFTIAARTTTSITVAFREIASEIEDMYFDFIIIAKNE